MAQSEALPIEADPLRALFDQARDGDEQALATLCKTMRPRLYRTAYSVLHDADEADDVAQEALVRVVTKRFLFLGRGSVGGWMTRIALNLAKNRTRDGKRRRAILEGSASGERSARGAEPRAVTSPEDNAVDAETKKILAAAMDQLSERQRDVVRLRVVADLPFAEVAQTLGMSEANARVTFSQAKKKMLEVAHVG